MKSRRSPRLRPVTGSRLTCPQCGGDGITTLSHRHSFNYGAGEEAVELTVDLPVRRCGACEFEYLDHVGESLEHQAICRHLGVLSPDEIRRVRIGHRMTRARFAHVTGIGEASLNRWENGLTVQTHANDRYLRLLARPENMQRLLSFVAAKRRTLAAPGIGGSRFRVLEVSDEMRRAQERFDLRLAG